MCVGGGGGGLLLLLLLLLLAVVLATMAAGRVAWLGAPAADAGGKSSSMSSVQLRNSSCGPNNGIAVFLNGFRHMDCLSF